MIVVEDSSNAEAAFAEAPAATIVDFQSVAGKKRKLNAFCWGCVHPFRKPQIPGDWPEMDRIWEKYVENMESMPEDQLAYLISKKQEQEIVKPKLIELEARQSMSRTPQEIQEDALALTTLYWPPEDVLTHFKFHMSDHKRSVQSQIRDCAVIQASIMDKMYSKIGDLSESTDYAAIAAFIKVGTYQSMLRSSLKSSLK